MLFCFGGRGFFNVGCRLYVISYASCWFPHGDVLTGANFFPGESDVVVVGCCLVWMEGNILEDRVGLREAIESAKCDACAMQPLDGVWILLPVVAATS